MRSATAERLAPEAAARQGQVTSMALQAFGDRHRVIAFLNTHDDSLGGRPLDLAIAGASGLAAVAGVMADRARLAPAAPSPVHRPSNDEPSGAPDRETVASGLDGA